MFVVAAMSAATIADGASTTTAPAITPATLPTDRLEIQINGLTIEYSPEDEAFAREIGSWLADRRLEYLKRLDDGGRAYTALMGIGRDVDLRFIADQLALDAPTSEMGKVYDFFGVSVLASVKPILRFDRATVWRATELTRRLRAGEKIAMFSIDEKGKPTYNWNFSFKSSIDEPIPASQPSSTPPPLVIPLLVRDDDPKRDAGTMDREKRETLRMLESLADPKFTYGRMTEQLAVLALHEVTESAMALQYLKSADRRWFLDGVANYVAYERARQKFGAQTVEALYRGSYRPEKYARWLDKVDLDRWPTVENQDASSPTGEFLHAHYYLATETIRTVADYHGPDLLPKLMRELKAVPRDKATIADVHAAFTKLTGDDLRQVIERTRRRLIRAAADVTTQPATSPAAP